MADREWVAWRVAQELRDGDIVNLGIGIPTLIPKYVPEGVTVYLQSENGLVGMGPPPAAGQEHPDLVNSAGQPVTMLPGAAVFDSFVSFGIIRGGHLDLAVLGALEVDAAGRIANWVIPGKFTPGMGGGMDLAVGAKRVIVAMTHATSGGKPKILPACTLPLTSSRPVDKIVTDMAVIEVTGEGLVLRELAPGTDLDTVLACTTAELRVAV
jgi:acetate CoA/acetoacetate CoA-transferase beta subunit